MALLTLCIAVRREVGVTTKLKVISVDVDEFHTTWDGFEIVDAESHEVDNETCETDFIHFTGSMKPSLRNEIESAARARGLDPESVRKICKAALCLAKQGRASTKKSVC